MSVKSEVLKLLEANRDSSLSGQELAGHLGVTRAAIWKAVNSLKEEGYHIDAVNNRGYRLAKDNDVLSPEGIRLELKKAYQDYEIQIYKEVDSTNQVVKRQALEGKKQGLVVLAEEQSAGKGRRGRNFFSPMGTGIYMSVLFCPESEQAENIVLITTAAAVAVCRAVRKVLGEEPEIKWVNDVYLRGRKICGILTEAVSDFESGRIDTVVVGIGINYHVPEEGFPEELREIAGSVCTAGNLVPRNSLVAAVLNELYELYDGLAERSFLEDYRKWSNVLGKEVRFSSGDSWEYGKAVDIDDDGGLVVQCENGDNKVLRTGEITLRVC
ncbi:MAG: biotin--[acetyl-CoA-carboxylase] ligase [Lachnospiraceae bacterium]|nr:biotin--[acetyl-CoA-carboxylase] ligase [Lachnospiraceae bacterium]